jgi:DNA mismatch repair protein MutL
MADIIKLLPDHIANQIAAGEVVQRPASVVKELMENAIDAGGKNIKLIVKDAGKTLIQVIDDGIGMSETDARMSFERHATSKIKTAEEIFSIKTMGFRGEALASIAAVAQVELRTKKQDAEIGCKITIEGSRIIEQEACQTVAGTSISVKNLFFNIPARRAFLKADNIEMRHILDEFQQIALAHSDIFFSLHHNNEKIFHLPPGNLRQRIVGIFGHKTNQVLIPIKEETDVLLIYGFIGKPEFAKKVRGEQFFFVNNRFIKSSYLHHALMLAYEDLLPAKMYPMYCVFFEMDPAKIDVNVHPTKQEIKFEDEKLIYNYLRVTARHALAQNSITPSIDFEQDLTFIEQNSQHSNNSDGAENEGNVVLESRLSGSFSGFQSFKTESSEKENKGSGFAWKNEKTEQERNNLKNWEQLYQGLLSADNSEDEAVEMQNIESSISFSDQLKEAGNHSELNLKQLYQLHNAFIVTSIKSGMMLIDQAAAHQRILYEAFLQSMEHNIPLIQNTLFPVNVNLSPAQNSLMLEILPDLNSLGIDIREFGKNSFVIHGLPVELKSVNEQKLIEELLEQFRNGQTLKLNMRENLARSLAMQAAVKQGTVLSQIEMQRIVDQLFACEQPFNSPTGKKTFIRIEMTELLKRFE